MSDCLALIAHDTKKNDMVALVTNYQHVLSRYHLIATETTGQLIETVTGLPVERMAAGSQGGELQIAARVVSGEVAGVIFLLDPASVNPNEPDIRALLRVCTLHNVLLATNMATAELALQAVAKRRDAYLIFNPVAGQGNPDRDLAMIRQILAPQVNLHTIFTQPDIDPIDQAKAAIATIQANQTENDTGLIIASGGDGTVSAIAGATIQTGIPFGVIPRGTANAFAVAMGIPTDLKQACEAIAAGNTRVVDAAYCNNIPMILLAGVGFEAEMVENANRELKNQLGALAYILSGAQQLFSQELFKAEIEIDGETVEFDTVAVTVANAAPATSVAAQGFGEVIPDDGLLEVTIPLPQTRLQGVNVMATLFTSALVKSQVEREDVVCLRTKQLTLTTHPPQKLVVDGELCDANPIEFRCVPEGLTIFSPLLTVG
ncbi:methylglyoxal synthase [Leptolyngbya sp. Heron Island J]|uniref:methylglyoxal synthase n=1 Tax=Leptolyngbya sp. Heron Island J TaxID=1385935 RepID=UPI0003B954E7|nr:methylglyoxal synthase [Leptolyngbya sp. Heron Island J]ESA33233.1 methylglyoxal synthase [Leptolyngbya sp. Heron Island J]